MPYFLSGAFIGKLKTKKLTVKNVSKKNKIKKYNIILYIRKIISLILAICSIEFILKSKNINTSRILYGSLPYSALSYTPMTRFKIMLVAFFLIWFFIEWIPNKKIKYITALGENTMAIYLIHGFIIIWTKNNLFFKYSLMQNILIATGLTILIIFTLGNKKSATIFNNVFCCDKIFNLIKNHKKKLKSCSKMVNQ